MRVAITEWKDNISPVFDEANVVRLFDLEGSDSERLTLTGFGAAARAEALRKADVNTLICGAISPFAVQVLSMNGIEVHAWLHGSVNRALQAMREGWLDSDSFTMPGCQHLRDRNRGDS